jgi:hypothetical protein
MGEPAVALQQLDDRLIQVVHAALLPKFVAISFRPAAHHNEYTDASAAVLPAHPSHPCRQIVIMALAFAFDPLAGDRNRFLE